MVGSMVQGILFYIKQLLCILVYIKSKILYIIKLFELNLIIETIFLLKFY